MIKVTTINNGRFKKGFTPWNKGRKWSEASKQKMSRAKQGKHYSPKTEFKKGEHLGTNNFKWKGDKVGYFGLHTWVQRQLGKAEKCEKCNDKNAPKYEWANISRAYKRELTDWISLCKKCHIGFDNVIRKGWITRKEKILDV